MNHKDLKVWKKSVALAVDVYSATRSFPSHEKFGITSQMRRASVPIPSNIAEGAARRGIKEFLQFLYIAAGSASELTTQLIISAQVGLLEEVTAETLTGQIEEITKMIHGLIKSVEKKL